LTGELRLKAAILAGGAGTRLYPITAYVPKSLIPIGSRYVIEHILEYLKRYNVLDIVMLISEKESDLLRNHLDDGKRLGVNIEYSVAERIGTAGALGAASTLLGDRFLVYYGDVLTDMNLADMIRFHEDRRATCTIAMSTSVPMEYGVARVAEDGRVTYFEEKPIIKEYPVSMGILICEKEVLEYCKPNTDISHEIVPELLRDKKRVFAYLTSKRHYDIGTFKNLEEVRARVGESRSPFQLS
jgi:mannose-1-phosphate guanylyltransferase/phosphomannomutase